jgi:hypothetical protein
MPKTSNPIQNLKKLATQGFSAAKKIARAENKINNELTKAVGLKRGDNTPSRYVRRGKAKKSNQKKRVRRTNTINFPDKDTMAKTCIHKREFVTFINGSTGQAINSQPVSMQNVFMFPWGSSVLPQYELYQLKNLSFHFESTYPMITTGGSLGVIVMGLVYDPDDPTLGDIATMLNYQGFQNRRIDKSYSIHWDPRHNPLPVRYISHNPNANPFNDSAVFYWATNGNPNTNQIGELWVEYDIELFIPRPSVAPLFQLVSISTGAINISPTQKMFDLNYGVIPASNMYGQNYITITQRTVQDPIFNVNVPGFYMVIFQYTANGSSFITSLASSNWTYTNVTRLNIPTTGEGISSNVFDTACGNGGNLTALGSDTLYIDASTNYIQGSTSFTGGVTLTTTAGAIGGVNTDMWVYKVPKLVTGVVPTLPEVSRLQQDVNELKAILRDGYLSKRESDDIVMTPILNPPPTPAKYFNNWVGSKSQSLK